MWTKLIKYQTVTYTWKKYNNITGWQGQDMIEERQVKWVMTNNRIQHIHASAKLIKINIKLSFSHGQKIQRSVVSRDRRGERHLKWVMDNNRTQHIHGSAQLIPNCHLHMDQNNKNHWLTGRGQESKRERDWCISTVPRFL